MGSGNIGLAWIVVLNAIIKNISFISWRSVLLVLLVLYVVSSTPRNERGSNSQQH